MKTVKKLYFFPRSLRSLGLSKIQINFIWIIVAQKFIKYFFFSVLNLYMSLEEPFFNLYFLLKNL